MEGIREKGSEIKLDIPCLERSLLLAKPLPHVEQRCVFAVAWPAGREAFISVGPS